MSDLAFIALTIAVFAVLALAVRGVERLVGSDDEDRAQRTDPSPGSERERRPFSASSIGGYGDGQVTSS